jgi:hypothetical protein
MAQNRGISKVHSQITVKTGLAGWGGRIRISASGIAAGLATASAERVVAGGKSIEVARVRITEAGRRALKGTGR